MAASHLRYETAPRMGWSQCWVRAAVLSSRIFQDVPFLRGGITNLFQWIACSTHGSVLFKKIPSLWIFVRFTDSGAKFVEISIRPFIMVCREDFFVRPACGNRRRVVSDL